MSSSSLSASAAPLASMTGYAAASGEAAPGGAALLWSWELRSVNGKGLDVRPRAPAGFDWIEIPARERIAARLARGNVTATLDVRRESAAAAAGLAINRPLLEAVLALHAELAGRVDPAPPRLEGLLALRGMIEAEPQTDRGGPDRGGPDRATLEPILLAGLDAALDGLIAMRRAEGARLGRLIAEQMDETARLTAAARGLAALAPQQALARIKAQLAALGTDGVAPERLAQEAALLAAKADATEELDRLDAHVAQVRALLAAGGPVGRRLDFLAQEFGREANTLAAKAGDIAVTQGALALKGVIDQFREQLQNLE